jgi:phosphocarrier protein
MKTFEYTITDPVGIHARPAGMLAKEAKKLAPTVISVTKGDRTVNVTQLMKLMGMGVVKGDEVTIQVEGDDEDAAAAAIEAFLKANM